MSEPQHTPGPWKTGDCDGFIVWAGGYRSVKWIECEPGPEAVHIGDAACPGWALRPEIEAKLSLDDLMAREAWIEECRANARLMAAAPDLLKHISRFQEILAGDQLLQIDPELQELAADIETTLIQAEILR